MSALAYKIRVFRSGLGVGWADLKLFWTPQSWLVGWLLRTACNVLMWVLLGRLIGSEQTAHFLLIGNALLTGAAAACWTIPVSTWDRWDGVYPLLVVSPSSLLPAAAGRAFIWPLNGIATSWLVYLILGLGVGLHFPARALLLVPWLVVLVCLSTFGYSLFVSAFVARNPRSRIIINFGTANLLMALTGVSVPISFWPEPVQLLAQVLPVTHGLRAVRACFEDAPLHAIGGFALRELTVGTVWLLLSSLVLDRMANAGRRDGTVDFVG